MMAQRCCRHRARCPSHCWLTLAAALPQVNVVVHVDQPPLGRHDAWMTKRVVSAAEEFVLGWAHGNATIDVATDPRGLRGAWLAAWIPRDLSSLGIVLEDDLELSPQWHRWLARAHRRYHGAVLEQRLAGISLQRLTVRPDGLPLTDLPQRAAFLSPVVSSWAFAPTASHWREFVAWTRAGHSSVGMNSTWGGAGGGAASLAASGLGGSAIATSSLPSRDVWTSEFASFCASRNLVTLYPGPGGGVGGWGAQGVALAVNWREHGVHFNGGGGADFKLREGGAWTADDEELPSAEELVAALEGASLHAVTSYTVLAIANSTDPTASAASHLPISVRHRRAYDVWLSIQSAYDAQAAAHAGGDNSTGEVLESDDFGAVYQWRNTRLDALVQPTAAQLGLLSSILAYLFFLTIARVATACLGMRHFRVPAAFPTIIAAAGPLLELVGWVALAATCEFLVPAIPVTRPPESTRHGGRSKSQPNGPEDDPPPPHPPKTTSTPTPTSMPTPTPTHPPTLTP